MHLTPPLLVMGYNNENEEQNLSEDQSLNELGSYADRINNTQRNVRKLVDNYQMRKTRTDPEPRAKNGSSSIESEAEKKANSSSKNNEFRTKNNTTSANKTGAATGPTTGSATGAGASAGTTATTGSATTGAATASGTAAAGGTAAASGTAAAGGTAAAAGGVALAPVIAVALAIFLALFLIAGAATLFNSPSSVMNLFLEQFKQTEAGQMITDVSDAFSNIVENISNWFNGILGIKDEEEDLISEAYGVNPEYYDQLQYNKKIIDKAFKKAYNDALECLERICMDEGYNYADVKKTLVQTHSDSWEAVYAKANYGDLINAINIAKFGYDKNGEKIPFSKNTFNGILKDSDNYEYLYHITFEYTDSIPIAKITPYSIESLYKMLNVKKDDIYFETTTIYQQQVISLEVLRAQAEGLDINLGLYNITDILSPDDAKRPSDITSDSSMVNQSYNATYVRNMLLREGYTPKAIAGVMGNIQAESAFSTALSGDSGSVGICQWLGARKERLYSLAEKMHLEPTSIIVQSQLLILEIREIPKLATILKSNSTSVIHATDAFCALFERPLNFASKEDFLKSKYADRFSWARFALSTYNNRYYIDLGKRRSFANGFYEAYGDSGTITNPIKPPPEQGTQSIDERGED